MDSNREMEVSLSLGSDSRIFLNYYLSTTSRLCPPSCTLPANEYPFIPTTPCAPDTSIRHGQCAEIFSQPSSPLRIALKKAQPPLEKCLEIINNSSQHQKVCSAFEKYGRLCHLPQHHSLIPAQDEERYAQYGDGLSSSKLAIAKASRERAPVLAMERLLPLS